MYKSVIVYDSSLLYEDHSSPNSIFGHRLYGSVWLLDRIRHIVDTLCLYILGGPVVPRTLGVRFCERTWRTLLFVENS